MARCPYLMMLAVLACSSGGRDSDNDVTVEVDDIGDIFADESSDGKNCAAPMTCPAFPAQWNVARAAEREDALGSFFGEDGVHCDTLGDARGVSVSCEDRSIAVSDVQSPCAVRDARGEVWVAAIVDRHLRWSDGVVVHDDPAPVCAIRDCAVRPEGGIIVLAQQCDSSALAASGLSTDGVVAREWPARSSDQQGYLVMVGGAPWVVTSWLDELRVFAPSANEPSSIVLDGHLLFALPFEDGETLGLVLVEQRPEADVVTAVTWEDGARRRREVYRTPLRPLVPVGDEQPEKRTIRERRAFVHDAAGGLHAFLGETGHGDATLYLSSADRRSWRVEAAEVEHLQPGIKHVSFDAAGVVHGTLRVLSNAYEGSDTFRSILEGPGCVGRCESR